MENQNRIMKCNETRHYKMYKAGKRILYASIAMIACGSWLFLSQDAHAAVTSNVSTTVNTPATGSANNSQVTDKDLGAAAGNTQDTNTTVGASKDSATKAVSNNLQTNADSTAGPTAANPSSSTSLKTIDQLSGQYIDDKGNVSSNKPAQTVGGNETSDANADMATNVTDNFSGQGGQNDDLPNVTSHHVVIASKPGEVGNNFGKVYQDGDGKQWVKLVSDANDVAASYSFKNQIDTTSSFNIKGEWYLSVPDKMVNQLIPVAVLVSFYSQ